MQKIMNPLRHTIMNRQNENNLTILRETKRETFSFKFKSAHRSIYFCQGHDAIFDLARAIGICHD